jgi:hypothetical protein
MEGKILDDRAVLARVSFDPRSGRLGPPPAEGREVVRETELAYVASGLRREIAKSVRWAPDFTFMGGEVRGRAGRCGAPEERRCVLSMLSLEAALLPVVTLGLVKTLYSSWIFCSLFRRPTLSIFGEVFTLEDLVGGDYEAPFRLPRRAANELVVASIVGFMMFTNLRAPAEPIVYALDASPWKGAVVSTGMSEEAARELYLRRDTRGG